MVGEGSSHTPAICHQKWNILSMPPEVEYSLNPRIGMDLIDSLSNREVSVRQRVDQENVGCFMTKAKERELRGKYISSRDLYWNKRSWNASVCRRLWKLSQEKVAE